MAPIGPPWQLVTTCICLSPSSAGSSPALIASSVTFNAPGMIPVVDAMASAALRELDAGGVLHFEQGEADCIVRLPERSRRRSQVQWRTRKAVAKALYFPRLLKSAATFGDWLPYALWKLKRHTGVEIEPTERQKRHPLIWGWPVLFRLLKEQSLR